MPAADSSTVAGCASHRLLKPASDDTGLCHGAAIASVLQLLVLHAVSGCRPACTMAVENMPATEQSDSGGDGDTAALY